MNQSLHERLIALQSDEELERKAKKSQERTRQWTQEELDWMRRNSAAMADFYKGLFA